MAQLVFRRLEQKYLLNESQVAALHVVMEQHMFPDKYPVSSIRNLYYDTPDFRLIRRSLEKPVYKEKLRLRAYGDVRQEDSVFLEMKKKYDGIVYKRRIALTEKEATDYMKDSDRSLGDSQIAREMDQFKQYYKNLAPRVFLAYDRHSWRSEDGSLRITLDQNIHYRIDALDLKTPTGGISLLQHGQVLIEIKSPTAMPMWLVGFLSKNKIFPTSYSKYGAAYLQLLKEQKITSGGYPYA